MNLNVLFVSDVPESALSTVARSRAKSLNASVVYASDFSNPLDLLKFISKGEYSRVLFCWRGALKEGLKLPRFQKVYAGLIPTVTFQCLIPDFVGLETRFVQEEEGLLKSVHGYLVTCEKLFQTYSVAFSNCQPSGILHDMPDVELINISYSNIQQNQIAWVGNSAWGARMGFVDHKGFNSILIPIISIYRKLRPEVEFKILDSHKGRVTHQQSLHLIAHSRVLLQTSKSEGTGLPVLEALGLGVVPVSTDVGIANEVLTGVLAKFIVKTSTVDFLRVLDEALDFSDRHILRNAFLKFVKEAEDEVISWNSYNFDLPDIRTTLQAVFKIRLLWLYRYYKSRNSKRFKLDRDASS